MVKVVAVIRPTETKRIEAEADDYPAARAAVDELVPAGWEVISYRQV